MKFLRLELTFKVKKAQGYLIPFLAFKAKQIFQQKNIKLKKKIEQNEKSIR